MNYLPHTRRLIPILALIFAISNLASAQDSTDVRGDSPYRLPAGTRIKLKMTAELHTAVSSVNDTFTASVAEPVMVRDIVALPTGTMFEGRITKITRAGAIGRDGRIDFVIDKMLVGNDITRSVETATVTQFRPQSTQTLTALSIAGGTVVGALIGYFAKPGSGALIGAGAGAGIGTVAAIAKKGKDVRIKEKQVFEIELKSELILPVLDY